VNRKWREHHADVFIADVFIADVFIDLPFAIYDLRL